VITEIIEVLSKSHYFTECTVEKKIERNRIAQGIHWSNGPHGLWFLFHNSVFFLRNCEK